jgi:hypothetical protein
LSEYQYYEFQTIDRPLTDKEMSELRSYSTRAVITPASFVNDYSWGSFKGDEDAWMEKYFDAFLYLANWGTRVFKVRLPSRLLDPRTARDYCNGDGALVRDKSGKTILSFISEDEADGDWVEGEGHLSSMISVRSELARGDLRALYLGWLLNAQAGELDDEDVEPPVPPGLGQLSASLESLVDFLRIDSDLIHVAAEASPSLAEPRLEREDVRAWVHKLPASQKDEVITTFIVDGDHAPVAEMLQKFLKQRSGIPKGVSRARRTVGELLRAAEASAEERRRIENEERAKDKARREREAAHAREKYLDSIESSEQKLWADVETLIATVQPKGYDQAIKLLIDLRDLDVRTNRGDFRVRIEALRHSHSRKRNLIERLTKEGF